MEKNVKELAEKAAEINEVSEQNLEAWVAGFLSGMEHASAYVYRVVAKSCTQMAEFCEASQKNAKTEE